MCVCRELWCVVCVCVCVCDWYEDGCDVDLIEIKS